MKFALSFDFTYCAKSFAKPLDATSDSMNTSASSFFVVILLVETPFLRSKFLIPCSSLRTAIPTALPISCNCSKCKESKIIENFLNASGKEQSEAKKQDNTFSLVFLAGILALS